MHPAPIIVQVILAGPVRMLYVQVYEQVVLYRDQPFTEKGAQKQD